MPPDLVRLGDELEAAANRDLELRRTRRQAVLNGAASLVLAVPLALAAASSGGPASAPEPLLEPTRAKVVTQVPSDAIPRDLRRRRGALNADMLLLPANLRRAVR